MCSSDLVHINFDTDSVYEKLILLNVNKSPGPDGVTPRVIKKLAGKMAPVLCVISQKSYDEGIVPL